MWKSGFRIRCLYMAYTPYMSYIPPDKVIHRQRRQRSHSHRQRTFIDIEQR